MGLRFQRSMQLIPGVRLNFSKSGIGTSFGVRGARYSISPTGRRTVSAGIPGTGLSWRQSASAARSRGGAEGGDSAYAAKFADPQGVGCFPIGLAILGTLLFTSGIDARPVDAGIVVAGLVIGIAGYSIVLSRLNAKMRRRGVEDKRATPDGRPIEPNSDIPETLDEIIAEHDLYTSIYAAYLRAKRGEGGGEAVGIPLDSDEVALYELDAEFFDPSKDFNSISGTVAITNKRVIFDSIQRVHEWPLAKLLKVTITAPGQRVFSIKGRTKKYGLMFAEHVNDFDNAFGMALHLGNTRFSPDPPEPLVEDYLAKLAARRAELEAEK